MLQERLLGVLKLDIETYEEIEHDPQAISQAALVVGLVAIAGAVAKAAESGPIVSGGSSIISAFLSWWIGSWVVYKIGTGLFNADATHGEMLRVLGFAQAPAFLTILTPIPVAGPLIALSAAIWSLVTWFIAIRQGLDISNGQTVMTIVALILVYSVLIVGISIAVGVLIAMLGLAAGA